MQIEIFNWDKYNPRKDLKSLTWIRLDGDIGFSESLFGLSVEAKWLWVFLLSYSSKKNNGIFSIEENYLSHHSGIKLCELKKFLDDLSAKKLISVNSITTQARSDSIVSVEMANENVSYERTNERTNERTDEHDIVVDSVTDYTQPLEIKCELTVIPEKTGTLDLEALYFIYPGRKGKKKGMEKFKRIIKSQKVYDQVKQAITNYAIETKGTEQKFIKQFSTFSSVWEDYISPEKTKEEIEEQRLFEIDDARVRQMQKEMEEGL